MADLTQFLAMQANEDAARRAATSNALGNLLSVLQNVGAQKTRERELATARGLDAVARADQLRQQEFANKFNLDQADALQRHRDAQMELNKKQLDLYEKGLQTEVQQENKTRLNFGQALTAEAKKAVANFNKEKENFNQAVAEYGRLRETASRLGPNIVENKTTGLFELAPGAAPVYAPAVSKLNSAVIANQPKVKEAEANLKTALSGFEKLQRSAGGFQFGIDTDTGDVIDMLSGSPVPSKQPGMLDKIGQLIDQINQKTKNVEPRTQPAAPGLGAASPSAPEPLVAGPPPPPALALAALAGPPAPPQMPSRISRGVTGGLAPVAITPIPKTTNKPYAGWALPTALWEQIKQEASTVENAQPNPSPQGFSLRVEALMDAAYKNGLLVPPRTPQSFFERLGAMPGIPQ